MKIISGGVTAPRGFKAQGINCGIKKRKKDLALLYSEVPALAAGVFTGSKIKAAPLLLDLKHLRRSLAQAIIINSGNANSCTGRKGLVSARRMANLTAGKLGVPESSVLVASTGVIGVPLPLEKIEKGIGRIFNRLSYQGGTEAARAIMTTDTLPKEIALEFRIKGKTVKIGAMAKGAGMISPHLATLLVFITTDAFIERRLLKKALKNSVGESFNMITIDGDMSTNDTVLLLANGKAGNSQIKDKTRDCRIFQKALDFTTLSLAKMIVKDGEGATKFVEINLRKAKTLEEAKKAAFSIANSNLVKTALFGEDPNWGRIMSALGQAGIGQEEKIDIYLGKKKWVSQGYRERLKEREARKILKEPEIKITVDLNRGKKEALVYTCDLSSDYVKINANYRT
jgi:glutamate N-acetyltransferase/amino-acid N-acetyltransferase